MGETVKPWLMSVQSEMVELIDQLAQGSGLARPDFMRKILAQGIAVERQLQAEGYRKVTEDLRGKSEAQQTSRATAASEAKPSTPLGKSAAPVPQKVRKSARSAPRSTGLENAPPALHECINEDAPSRPITAPAASAPTGEPSVTPEPASEPLAAKKCVGCDSAAELGELTCGNPFCALSIPDTSAAPIDALT